MTTRPSKPPGDGERATAAASSPTHSPRIWSNERGKFYVVADEAYWSSRAAVTQQRGYR